MVEARREGGTFLHKCQGDLFVIITMLNLFQSSSGQTCSTVRKTKGERIVTTKKVELCLFLNK